MLPKQLIELNYRNEIAWHVDISSLFTRDPIRVGILENEIVGFDETLALVS